MTRRLSLAGQLLALQVVIICVVLVGVAAVTVAQSTQGAQETEGRRAHAIAETLANSRASRDGAARTGRRSSSASPRGEHPQHLRLGVGRRRTGGPHRPRQRRPRPAGSRFDVGGSTVLEGRSWVGERPFAGRPGGDRHGADPRPGAATSSVSSPSSGPIPSHHRRAGGRRAQPADLPRPRQRPRHRRLAAGRPPGEAADPRPGAARDRRPRGAPGRDAARHPRRHSRTGPARAGDPRQRRGDPAAAHPRRRARPHAGRTGCGGGAARRAALGRRWSATAPSPAPGRVLVVNRLPISSHGRPDRFGDHAARPHRAAGAAPGARPHAARHRHPAGAGARVRQPAAHDRRTDRARGGRGGRAVRAPGQLQPVGVQRCGHRRRRAIPRWRRCSSPRRVRPPSSASTCASRPTPRCRPWTTSSAPTSPPSSATWWTTPWTRRPRRRERWVEVSLGLVDGDVDVVVRDSGPGVPPGMEREVFRRGVSTKGGSTPGSAASGCRSCTWSAPAAAVT